MTINYIVLLVVYFCLGICYINAYLKDTPTKIPWWAYIPIIILWPLSLWVAFVMDIFYFWKDEKVKRKP